MHDKNFMRETLLQGAQAFQAGKLQRRSFLALCGMAGFASASVLAGRAEAAAGEIVMWNWGGQSEECHQSAIGAAFTKDTGVPLKFDTSGPLQGKIKEMVDSGNVTADVCDADLFDAVALGKTGHLEALDYSVIDEMPPGRQPVKTVHRHETRRAQVMEFIRTEIDKGRQVYIIFPLIEESAKLDYENLMKGYEQVKSWFPEPTYWISMVHGKQPADQKETNMRRFVEHDTQIMVSTTVIEVGVNVPNATVMVIESSEKFGLSQLHQLRGRVGRGGEQSYCILMTGSKLGVDARERLAIMTATNNGFEIAEKDLALRGPGDIEGTRQSGALNLKLASLTQDRDLLEKAQVSAERVAEADPELAAPEHQLLRIFLQQRMGPVRWSGIA